MLKLRAMKFPRPRAVSRSRRAWAGSSRHRHCVSASVSYSRLATVCLAHCGVLMVGCKAAHRFLLTM